MSVPLWLPWLRTSSQRVVIFAAHADDEVIGAGAWLCGWPRVRVVHVTDGAPRDMADARRLGLTSREAYVAVRREERTRALALAGIDAEHTHDLGYVDGEAMHDLVGLTARVLALLAAAQPHVVVTHPYEGGHPDHDATAFAVHAASRLLARQGRQWPLVVEMTSYHAGPDGIETGCFIDAETDHTIIDARDAEAHAQRRHMLACYASQQETLRYFESDGQPLRIAPHYAFDTPPHPGRLFYEHFGWGVSGAAWRACARDASRHLSLSRALCH